MRFHPDLTRAERVSKSFISETSLPVMRFALRAGGALLRLGVRTRRGATGQRIWVYPAKGDQAAPALLWVHGGGLIFGSPLTEHRFMKRIRDRFNITIASPEYRFAPRHPYPAALDDVSAALDWLAAQPGVDPERIAVGGDSAGGHLAAALAIRARDRGGPRIAFQALHEPMLDDASRHSDMDPEGLRVWSPKINHFAWTAYLAGLETPPPTAAPARLSDATGLPPAFIGCGTADLFHPGCVTYAETLRAAHVPVETNWIEGGYHGFHAMEPKAQVSRDYTDRLIAAIGRGLGL